MKTQAYEIISGRFDEWKKRIDRIVKKANEHGGLVGYKVLGEKWWQVPEDRHARRYWDYTFYKARPGTWIKFIQVEVWGESPTIEGYEVVAVIDHKAEGVYNIVHDLVGSVPDRYRTVENDCDHCGYNRARKQTVVLRKEGSREFIQVGTSCLADFTGANDPHRASQLCQNYASLYQTPGGSVEDTIYDRDEFLAHCAAHIRHDNGFISKSRAGRDDWTALKAWRTMTEQTLEPSEDDHERAAKALEWVEFHAEDSDFVRKLKAVLDAPGLHEDHINIAAAVFSGLWRWEKNNVQQATDSGSHVGVEGERSEFVVTVVKRFSYRKRRYHYHDSDEGRGIVFEDKDGNVLKWFTTYGAASKLRGDGPYRIAATVKKHDGFRGKAETIVSRVSVVEEVS